MGLAQVAVSLLTLAASANPHLVEGRSLYERGDFSGALQALIKALDGKSSKKERAQVHTYIGLIQYRYDLRGDARASFAEALQYDPDIQFPDPSQDAAKKLFFRIRKKQVGEEREVKPEPRERRKKRFRRRRASRDHGARAPPASEMADDTVEDPSEDVEPSPAPVVASPERKTEAVAMVTQSDPSAVASAPEARSPASAEGPELVVTPPPLEEGPDAARIGGWIGLGAGTVAVASGVVFAVLSTTNGAAALDEPVAKRAEDLHNAAVGQRTVSIVSFATAGVSLGIAAYLLLAE